MEKNKFVIGTIFVGLLVSMNACNHPRTEGEQPRMPIEREMSPHDGPSSTTDTAYNDSINRIDSVRYPSDPATPNF